MCIRIGAAGLFCPSSGLWTFSVCTADCGLFLSVQLQLQQKWPNFSKKKHKWPNHKNRRGETGSSRDKLLNSHTASGQLISSYYCSRFSPSQKKKTPTSKFVRTYTVQHKLASFLVRPASSIEHISLAPKLKS